MKQQSRVKSDLLAALQWLGAVIAFPIALTIGSMILPLSKTITDAAPATGMFSLPAAGGRGLHLP